MSLKLKLTQTVGKQLLAAQKHSPVLLIGVGVAGFVGTIALSVKATLKLDELVLQDAEKDIKRVKEETREDYTEKNRKHDLTKIYVRSAIRTARLYAPAFGLGVLSIAALTGSHIILTRRNVSLVAAYATIEQSFKQYRDRVIADVGAEKDREYRHGVVEREIAVDTDQGPVVKTVKSYDPNGISGYAREFAKGKTRNWQKVHRENLNFLRMQQNWANDKLQVNGYLFLSDVYKDLGLEPDKASHVVGWVLGKGDDFVSFGILDDDIDAAVDFYHGHEQSILLDFNVTGNILDLIPTTVDNEFHIPGHLGN
jgi:hypothetical protein